MSTEKKFASGPVNVADLSIHPILHDAPHLAKKDPRYLAMKASWEESGVIPTILITPSGQIVDGRHRYWFAKDQGAELIDAKVIAPNQVPRIIVGALSGRNHGTKSQIAYLSAPALQAAFEQARTRRELIQKSGGKAKLPPVESAEDLGDGRLRIVLAVGGDAWLERLLLRLGPVARVVDPVLDGVDPSNGPLMSRADVDRIMASIGRRMLDLYR